jgi:hypothetical protein
MSAGDYSLDPSRHKPFSPGSETRTRYALAGALSRPGAVVRRRLGST